MVNYTYWDNDFPIKITTGKTCVIAEFTLNGMTFKGEAKLDPNDKFNPEVGYDLSLSRALEAASKYYNKRAWSEIKHQDDIKEHHELLKKNKRQQRTLS